MLDTMFSCESESEDVIVAVAVVPVVPVVVGAKLNKLEVVWVVLLLVLLLLFVKSGEVIKVLLEDDCGCGFEEKCLVIVVIRSVSWSI